MRRLFQSSVHKVSHLPGFEPTVFSLSLYSHFHILLKESFECELFAQSSQDFLLSSFQSEPSRLSSFLFFEQGFFISRVHPFLGPYQKAGGPSCVSYATSGFITSVAFGVLPVRVAISPPRLSTAVLICHRCGRRKISFIISFFSKRTRKHFFCLH